MKIYSSEPLPTNPIKWHKDQVIVFFNHRDNGKMPEGQEGSRYDADFTVSKTAEKDDVLYAVRRNLHDPDLDDAVSNNFEIDGKPSVQIEKKYAQDLPEITVTEIIYDTTLIKEREVISSDVDPVDTVIRKVSGGLRNYVVAATAGSRTSDTDKDVERLINDGCVIITAK